ncbi:hypothetical protein ARTSIC4J27_4554 [Pseudarthrobacter siccitolerans]|uniref:Uncharacterized protein n=1 Tax=Pseudarthrobacter siccitolerans TaxID=861266 RepID=A0A024H8S2_9MICC|nr:hypothetical protein ARTSIC4J27_4554 [Pseudarthrobacter siccitolerans]
MWAATRSDSPAFIPLPLPCSNIWPGDDDVEVHKDPVHARDLLLDA